MFGYVSNESIGKERILDKGKLVLLFSAVLNSNL